MPAITAVREASNRPSAEILAKFDPRRAEFLRKMLSRAQKAKTWFKLDVLDAAGRAVVSDLVADGLVTLTPVEGSVMSADGADVPAERAGVSSGGSLVLTRRGRLLADAVVRALLP